MVCANPGDDVDDCIDLALLEVARPGRAFAYFDHNGVIVTLTKADTKESAKKAWEAGLLANHNAWTESIERAANIDWDKYDALHGK